MDRHERRQVMSAAVHGWTDRLKGREPVPVFSQQDAIYHMLGLTGINPPTGELDGYPERFTRETRQAYAFTTENIGEYIGGLNLKRKKIACIGGSSDFAFNAFAHGAKAVDVVDVSPVACFMGELKAAGLRELSYHEFLNFFATPGKNTFGPNSFSYERYRGLRRHISNEAEYFFDQLIGPRGNAPFLSPGGMIIDKLPGTMDKIREEDPYIRTQQEYEAAKRAQKPLTFYPQDMQTFLEQNRGSNYGFIHLSNIIAYPPYAQGDEFNMDEIDRTIKAAKDALAVGGEVLLFNFYDLYDGPENSDFLQDRYARMLGMSGRQILGTVPHNSEQGFSALVLQKQPEQFHTPGWDDQGYRI